MTMLCRRSVSTAGIFGATAAVMMIGVSGTTALGSTAFGSVARHGTAARSASRATPPTIKLIAAQNVITVTKPSEGVVYVDPGIWVASLGAPLQLDVQRASYARPVTITQVLKGPGSTRSTRRLPSSILDGWNGLRQFAHVRVRNAVGKMVGQSTYTFCPDQNSNVSRTNPGSAPTSPFPRQCLPPDPFPLGEVWGIARGWAVLPSEYSGYHLDAGTYTLTETISPVYLRLFGISANDATARVTVKVVKANRFSQMVQRGASECRRPGCMLAPTPHGFTRVTSGPAQDAMPSLPQARIIARPPTDALPDLIPLPAWFIDIQYKKQGEFLEFASTVLIGGHSQLDVQGFRIKGSQTLKAYQYFWHDGKIIGRARVGTMGFSGYNHWHFRQFAQYKLLNAAKKVVVNSTKVGFCIAPTDGVDLTLPHATWIPSHTGLPGSCGSPSALWVQEQLPLGWADTYYQTIPHQSFDISNIPNGTYYIEVIANPSHLLHETNTHNDVSLRRIILSGSGKHRRVRVPAWHGIDLEH